MEQGDTAAANDLFVRICLEDPAAEVELAAMLEAEQTQAEMAIAIDGTTERLVALYNGVIPLGRGTLTEKQLGLGPSGTCVWQYSIHTAP